MATYQQLPMVYYNTVGYFPESMDDAVTFVQKTYWPDMKEEDLRAQQLLTDPLSKNKEELQYFPLYDYRTKRPVSFLFLSAGIDGKIDNKLSHNDTLYVHNWWADLNVYNYEEAILLENYFTKITAPGNQLYTKLCNKYVANFTSLMRRENQQIQLMLILCYPVI